MIQMPRKSDDLIKLSTMFQSSLKHINQQNETQSRSLRECLSGVASTVKENSASMSECMISATNMMKECMMGMADLIKENSSQILQGVWEGLRFVIVALPGLFTYLFF